MKESKSLIAKTRKRGEGKLIMEIETDLYGAINWSKVCDLAKEIRRFLETHHQPYNVLEILMAFEIVKYSSIPEDLLKIKRN